MATNEKLTLAQAARVLNMPYPTLYRYWLEGRIRYEREAHAVLVTLADVKAGLKGYKRNKRHMPTLQGAE